MNKLVTGEFYIVIYCAHANAYNTQSSEMVIALQNGIVYFDAKRTSSHGE